MPLPVGTNPDTSKEREVYGDEQPAPPGAIPVGHQIGSPVATMAAACCEASGTLAPDLSNTTTLVPEGTCERTADVSAAGTVSVGDVSAVTATAVGVGLPSTDVLVLTSGAGVALSMTTVVGLPFTADVALVSTAVLVLFPGTDVTLVSDVVVVLLSGADGALLSIAAGVLLSDADVALLSTAAVVLLFGADVESVPEAPVDEACDPDCEAAPGCAGGGVTSSAKTGTALSALMASTNRTVNSNTLKRLFLWFIGLSPFISKKRLYNIRIIRI